MSRLARILGSFIVVVATWWVYSIAAVPFIEPQESHEAAAGISDEDRQRARSARSEQRSELGHWFAKDDWEVTSSPTILETGQGKLLFKSHTSDPKDARVVTLTPCTMIFLPDGKFETEAERNRRAVVLRAPAGADLRFQETFDLKHVQADNKLIGARLKGKVIIHSEQRSLGPEDDLLIVTQEVTMADDRITTPHLVEFTYGPNRGHGRDMRLDLYSAAEKAAQPTSGPVKAFELTREVYMRMEPGEADLFPGAGPQAAKPAPAAPRPANQPPGQPKPPVEITCQGPFRFETARYMATFKDRVEVLRLNTTGPSDQMTCERLDLEFEPDPTAAPAASGGSMPKLRPRRIIAEGTPVVLRSPSNGVEARGRKLNYDIQKRSGRLSDNDEAMLRQRLPPAAGHPAGDQREIHARELYFESDLENPSGPPKVFSATGKGWLRGSPPTEGGQAIFVRWTTALKFHPYQASQLLSILGDAHVETPDSGSLDAEKIYVWLRPAPPGTAAGGPNQRQFNPEKMLALGHVRPDSPQIEGEVGEMHVWFDEPAPPPPVAPGAAPAQPAPPSPPKAKRAMPDRRFHVSGDLLQAQVVHRGEQMDVSELTIDGHTRCAERPTALTADEPLVIVGDHLHLTQPTPEDMTVQVTGQPARIDARKMTLIGGSSASGGSIFLKKATNQLWVPGPGTMLLPVDRDMQGRPLAKPQPMTIDWQGRMDFDGQAADFKDKVVAHNAESQLRTPLLRAIFAEPVRFDGASEQRPQVERLICRQGVELEHRVIEGRRMTSWERMKARDLNYEYTTGDVAAQGPGRITRTWLDDGSSSPVLPGGGASSKQAKSAANPKGKPPAKPKISLVYLNATFEERLTGNQHREIMVLHGHVRAVYGPVADWRGKLNPDRPELLGESGFVLTCDQLDVAKNSARGQAQATFELTGLGNTVIEGAEFLARSRRLTYSSQSDRLVLEGDGWTGAQLYREHRKSVRPKDLVAGKISYWPKTQRIKLDDFHSVDFSHVQASEEDEDEAGKSAP
ncbi:MAG TPA: hypothetical protein VJ783_11380, partial [Pirellulales bacterium]|nr:hypothetical protein [Pirellulales bacterium]